MGDAYPDKMRTYGTERVREAGIDLVLGDRAEMPRLPYDSIITEKGLRIESDLVVRVVGSNHEGTEVFSRSQPSAGGSMLSTYDPSTRPSLLPMGPFVSIPLSKFDWPMVNRISLPLETLLTGAKRRISQKRRIMETLLSRTFLPRHVV